MAGTLLVFGLLLVTAVTDVRSASSATGLEAAYASGLGRWVQVSLQAEAICSALLQTLPAKLLGGFRA